MNAIFCDAKRASCDGRLGEFGREKRADEFSERLKKLLTAQDTTKTKTMTSHEQEFVNLVLELKRLNEAQPHDF